METAILFIVGLLLGALLTWGYLRSSSLLQSKVIDDQAARITELSQELKEAVQASSVLQQKVADHDTERAVMDSRLEQERKAADEKIAMLQSAREEMTREFENLANRIMEEKGQRFTSQNKQNLDEVLNPLREQISNFRKRVDDVYDKESKDRQSLYVQISNLEALNRKMSEDALNLTRALKGESKTRGNWGEVILERVLEDSGLSNGREYQAQGSFRNEEGKLLYPDVVVHLPDSKDVVIDSKVSLVAYERYYAAENEAARETALNEHVASVRNHIDGLSAKNYEQLTGINSLDLVLMFVPVEPALTLALEHDADLFHYAFGKGIYLVSPSTLSLNLQIIHNMWRYEYQNRNAQEIASRAGALYDKFVGFVESLDDIGKNLARAESSYQTARKRLHEGRGNLVRHTEELKKLGAKTKKSLPEELLPEESNDNIVRLERDED